MPTAMISDAEVKRKEGRTISIPFDNSYARLLEGMYVRVMPTPVAGPRILKFNRELADELKLDADAFESEDGAAIAAGNLVPQGAEPLAMAYAGHQFGHFVPQLGDGRAILLGEVIDRAGTRRDIQLKGAGRTPFSRQGDGRAALGPVLREYLISEAMHALRIPTTRALLAVTTGEAVRRESLQPGAILTRVAASHIRVGTFQYFAVRDDSASVKRLADFVIDRHYPQARTAKQPYLKLLEDVIDRQAQLVARWMQVGFIHGVMNTDNMAVSGETIDFGPCAFMDAYDPSTVFSSIDEGGRYAYGNQPPIAQWNLARLAETLLPLLDSDRNRAIEIATELVVTFSERYSKHWLEGMRRKLGLFTADEGDLGLVQAWLDALHANKVDFTLGFRRLCDATPVAGENADVRSLFANVSSYDQWAEQWRSRLGRELQSPQERAAAMRQANPSVIPRNHRVEHALEAAVERGDLSPFNELSAALANPYDDQIQFAFYTEPPGADEKVFRTYCGT